jgi:hypothetical protein
MARKVWLTITGIQKGFEQEEPVTLVTEGSYIYKNDVHYIFYSERTEEGAVIKNRLTISPGSVELRKTGAGNLIPFLYLIRSIIKTVFISHRQDRWNWYLTQRRSGCCMEMHILNYS